MVMEDSIIKFVEQMTRHPKECQSGWMQGMYLEHFAVRCLCLIITSEKGLANHASHANWTGALQLSITCTKIKEGRGPDGLRPL